jgi:hypothetical protein
LRGRGDAAVADDWRPVGPGRPGPDPAYRRVETRTYRVRVAEDGAPGAAAALCDGLFPLVTSEEALGWEAALAP